MAAGWQTTGERAPAAEEEDGKPSSELGDWLKKRHYSLDENWSWVILTGSCLAQVIISLIYVVGIFNVIFLDVFQNDRQTTAWLGAVQSSFLSLFGLPAGYINSRLGPRITTIIGALCGGAGFFLAYFANGFLSLLFTFGFLVGIGNGLVNLPSIIIMGSYFHRYRNLAFATSTATVGLGALLLPPIINYCTTVYGWRGCMLIMSGIYLHLLVVGGVMRPQHIPSQLLAPDTETARPKRTVFPTGGELSPSSTPSLSHADTTKLQRNDIKFLSLKDLGSESSVVWLVNEERRSKSCWDLPTGRAQGTMREVRQMQMSPRGRLEGTKDEASDDGIFKLAEASRSGRHERAIDQASETGNIAASELVEKKETLGEFGGDHESKRGSESSDQARSAAVADGSSTSRASCVRILRNKGLMLLNVHYFSATAANFTSYLHFPAYFVGKGASPAELTATMALVGASNSASRFLSGVLTNAIDDGVLLLYVAAGGLTSLSLFLCPILSDSDVGRLSFAFAFSFYGNAISAVRAAMTLELCSLEELSLAFGVELFVGGVSGLIGPPFAGWLYDVSGDYVISFLFAGSLYMFGTILMMMLPVMGASSQREQSKPSSNV